MQNVSKMFVPQEHTMEKFARSITETMRFVPLESRVFVENFHVRALNLSKNSLTVDDIGHLYANQTRQASID